MLLVASAPANAPRSRARRSGPRPPTSQGPPRVRATLRERPRQGAVRPTSHGADGFESRPPRHTPLPCARFGRFGAGGSRQGPLRVHVAGYRRAPAGTGRRERPPSRTPCSTPFRERQAPNASGRCAVGFQKSAISPLSLASGSPASPATRSTSAARRSTLRGAASFGSSSRGSGTPRRCPSRPSTRRANPAARRNLHSHAIRK